MVDAFCETFGINNHNNKPIMAIDAQRQKPPVAQSAPAAPPACVAPAIVGAISANAFRSFVRAAASTPKTSSSMPPLFLESRSLLLLAAADLEQAKLTELYPATLVLVHRTTDADEDTTTTKNDHRVHEEEEDNDRTLLRAERLPDIGYFVSALPPTRSTLRQCMLARARSEPERSTVERVELAQALTAFSVLVPSAHAAFRLRTYAIMCLRQPSQAKALWCTWTDPQQGDTLQTCLRDYWFTPMHVDIGLFARLFFRAMELREKPIGGGGETLRYSARIIPSATDAAAPSCLLGTLECGRRRYRFHRLAHHP